MRLVEISESPSLPLSLTFFDRFDLSDPELLTHLRNSEYITDYLAIGMKETYKVTNRLPRWALYLITGAIGSFMLQFFHRGETKKAEERERRKQELLAEKERLEKEKERLEKEKAESEKEGGKEKEKKSPSKGGKGKKGGKK